MLKYFSLILFLTCALSAQTIITEQSEDKRPLVITRMDFNVKAIGFLAETEVIMTFANPNDEQLIGNFYLPIPDQSTVTGYALDINGKLVDAVAIEKVRARQVFEEITRRRVDPGLLEWSKGNNFKTRVYPLPARGTRTVKVKILTEMKKVEGGFKYLFPLKFSDSTNILTLQIDGVYDKKPEIATEDFSGMVFEQTPEGEFHGSIKKFKIKPDSVEIFFPDKHEEWQFIFKENAKELYYVYGKSVQPKKQKRKPVEKYTVLWDASHSRNSSKRDQEIEFLKRILSKNKAKFVIELVVFRHKSETPKVFFIEEGKLDNFLDYLKSLKYDGGTLLEYSQISNLNRRSEEIILFSDGLTTLNTLNSIHDLDSRITIINSSPILDRLLFKKILSKNPGRFINLLDHTLEQAEKLYFDTSISFDSEGENYIDDFPRNDQNVNEIFTRTGKISNGERTYNIKLNNSQKENLSYIISDDDRVGGPLVKTYFAMQKLEALLLEGNKNSIKEHGKKFHLVTPFTSLIVLEIYDDYVRYGIEPPKSLPKWREKFLTENSIANVGFNPSEKWLKQRTYRDWQDFVSWWETDFKYPEGFIWQKNIFFLPDYIDAGLLEIVETKTSEGLGGGSDLGGFGVGGIGGGEFDSAEADPFAEPLDVPGEEPVEESSIEKVTITKESFEDNSEELKMIRNSVSPYNVYLNQKIKHGGNPDFYLKVATVLMEKNLKDKAALVSSNVAEIASGNVSYLRKLGLFFTQCEEHFLAENVYRLVVEERPDEPQSWRDLALSLSAQKKYKDALDILNDAIFKYYPRFRLNEILVLEMNRILSILADEKDNVELVTDRKLVNDVGMDLRVVVTWNADNYNLNLSVVEPSGEPVSAYSSPSTIGGVISNDFPSYGPEQYILKKAVSGSYNLVIKNVGNRTQEAVGDVMCRVDIITDFGRKNEVVSSHYLTFNKENYIHKLNVTLGMKKGSISKQEIPDHIILSPFDSVISLAAKMKTYGFVWQQVKAANPEVDWEDLNTGQKIKVPVKN